MFPQLTRLCINPGYRRLKLCPLLHMSCQTKHTDALEIFRTGIQSVSPDWLIRENISTSSGYIQIGGHLIDPSKKRLHVVAFGKAVIGMVAETNRILSHYIHDGIAIVPKGIKEQLRTFGKETLIPDNNCPVTLYEGAHLNIPDADCVAASHKVKQLVAKLDENDVLLTLVSGGGSALLSLPKEPLTLPDLRKVTKLLSTNGCTISEMNAVRQHLEQLKGGGLSSLAAPAQVISLILSDVVGDPLNFIASGPTVEVETTSDDALQIIAKYLSADQVPTSVFEALKVPNFTSENKLVTNRLIGTNIIALRACAEKARAIGYFPLIIQSNLTGDAQKAAQDFASLALRLIDSDNQIGFLSGLFNSLCVEDRKKAEASLCNWSQNKQRPICILAGGETTVNVTGSGTGGRNQEMALKAAMELSSLQTSRHIHETVTFASVGTDGQDGPTEAAGASVTHRILDNQEDVKMAADYLRNNDSNSFFRKDKFKESLITTGLTGINVMDIQILMINSSNLSQPIAVTF